MTEIKTDINFIQIATDVAKIKQAVLGNGTPGLCQRVANIEEDLKRWQKRQGWVSGFCSGLGFIFGGCITYLIDFLKGG